MVDVIFDLLVCFYRNDVLEMFFDYVWITSKEFNFKDFVIILKLQNLNTNKCVLVDSLKISFIIKLERSRGQVHHFQHFLNCVWDNPSKLYDSCHKKVYINVLDVLLFFLITFYLYRENYSRKQISSYNCAKVGSNGNIYIDYSLFTEFF